MTIDFKPGQSLYNRAAYSVIPAEPHSALQNARDLMRCYDQNFLSHADTIAAAELIISELKILANTALNETMEGCCLLLKLRDDRFLQATLKEITLFFYCTFLVGEVDDNCYQQFINAELSLSETIEFHIRSECSKETLFLFLDLYLNVLEHLWLIPPLKNNAEISLLKRECSFSIKNKAANWMKLLNREALKEKKLERYLANLEQMLSKLTDSLSQAVITIIQSNTQSFEHLSTPDPAFFVFLNNIYLATEHYFRAIDHSLRALDYIEKRLYYDHEILKMANEYNLIELIETNQIEILESSLIKECIVETSKFSLIKVSFINTLGLSYMTLGELDQAADYFKQFLKIIQEGNYLELELIAIHNMGTISSLKGDFETASKYFDELLNLAKKLENRQKVQTAYCCLGRAYHDKKEFNKALDYYHEALDLILDSDGLVVKGEIYTSLGKTYSALRQFEKAKEYFNKALTIITKESLPPLEREVYHELGITEYALGNYQQAINYLVPVLVKCRELKLSLNELRVSHDLGCVYLSFGKYRKAMHCVFKSFSIAAQLDDMNHLVLCNHTLGVIHLQLGDYEQARASFQSSLFLAKKRNHPILNVVYSNLAQTYLAVNDFPRATDYLNQQMEFLSEQKNYANEAQIRSITGNIHFKQQKYSQAIESHTIDLKISCETEDLSGQARAHANLGRVFLEQNQLNESKKSFKELLKIARQLKNPLLIFEGKSNLGTVYLQGKNYVKAEKYLRKSIDIFFQLKKELKYSAQKQITCFENLSQSFKALEAILVNQGKFDEALRVTESRRSLFLNSALAKNLSLPDEESMVSLDEMRDLAKNCNATLIVYSLTYLPEDPKWFAWVISKDSITPIELSLDGYAAKQSISELLQEFPFDRKRTPFSSEIPALTSISKLRVGGGSEKDFESLQFVRKELRTNLFQWYDTLIAPLEQYLPKNPKETLIIVPEGFLSQLPWGLFLDFEGRYLIEKYPIAAVPSIKTLSLLAKKPSLGRSLSKHTLIMGNPDTGNSNDNLPFAHKEAQVLNKVFQLEEHRLLLNEKEATPQRIKQESLQAHRIFLSCHGLPNKKNLKLDIEDVHNHISVLEGKLSIFEGCLKLVPDSEHRLGFLDSEEISKLNLLQTEFVCLSSCFSGTGGLWEEGSIGLVRSFILAGASTVMAAYWPVCDSKITVSMVEKMAQNLLAPSESRLTHAQALQQIMVEMIATYPDNVEEWGVFFLTGID